MKRFLLVCAAVVSWHAPAGARYVEKAFPGCTVGARYCIVSNNPGGGTATFTFAAAEMIAHNTLAVVSGECASACASALDVGRAHGLRVCLLPSASFLFHKGTLRMADAYGDYTIEIGYFDPPQSAPVKRWITQRGGFPHSNTRATMLRMPFETAARYWRMCTKADLDIP